MQLLRKVASFGASREDMIHIYTLFVKSALEHSSSVWHRNLTNENENDIERVQKSAFRIILNNEYISYENALNTLRMETLTNRREVLFRKFTIKSLQVKQMNTILVRNENTEYMNTRNKEKYKIENTNIKRFQKSTGIQMQHVINDID